MAAYRPVYDSRHLQADYQEPGSALEPYARQSSMVYLFSHDLGGGVPAPPGPSVEPSLLALSLVHVGVLHLRGHSAVTTSES